MPTFRSLLFALFASFGFGDPGDFQWSYPTLGIVYSSPAIDGAGNLYVGSEDGNLYSLTSQGGFRWIFTQSTDWIDSSPAYAIR